MASLVDTGLTNAVRQATQGKRDALRLMIDRIGSTVGDVGGNLVNRGQEHKAKRAQMQAYSDSLADQKTNLERERQRLIDLNSQYTQSDNGVISDEPLPRSSSTIDRETQARSIDKRIGEIDTAQERMPIGNMNYRNFRRTHAPALPQRQDYDSSLDVREFERGQDAEREQSRYDAEQAQLSAQAEQSRLDRAAKESESKRRYDQTFAQRERAIQARPPQETTQQKKAAALDAKREEGYRANAEGAIEFKRQVAQLQPLIDKYGDELFGPLEGGGGIYEGAAKLFGTDVARARDEYDAILSALELGVAKMKLKGSGVITEGERAIARQTVPARSISDKEAANAIIKQLNEEADQSIANADRLGIDYVGKPEPMQNQVRKKGRFSEKDEAD
ncbi:hypothetical protein [uncultured Paraglaciecola sp.]|uniref:hypothetical protein n=1 Tax=uncultured Paraglaciecola sp. TaxID=1765024 RepID=UPI00262BC4AD|nr:hypothetical protein [uncultured Paraglaciecola sp.]